MAFLAEIWANKWVKFLALLLAVCLGVAFIVRISAVLTALAVAWLFAYICDPLVDRLESRRVSRVAAVVILAVFLVLVVVAVQGILIPLILGEFRTLSQNLPDYGAIVTDRLLPRIESALGTTLPRDNQEFAAFVHANRETFNRVGQALYSPVYAVARQAFSSVAGFISGLLILIVIPVAWFYLLRDIDKLNARVLDLLPPRHRPGFADFARQVDAIVANFLRGQIIVALLLASMYAIGLGLILDIPLGVVIGLFAGLVSIVPYLGLVVGIVPAMVMAFLQYQDWQHPLGVVAVFAVAQAIEGNFITPRIVGDKLGLNPVVVIFALLIGAELLGVLGMLIAVPAAAVLRVLIDRWLVRYQAGDFYRGGQTP